MWALRYVLATKAGEGSFSCVYKGWDTDEDCWVAMKVRKRAPPAPELECMAKRARTLARPRVRVHGLGGDVHVTVSSPAQFTLSSGKEEYTILRQLHDASEACS